MRITGSLSLNRLMWTRRIFQGHSVACLGARGTGVCEFIMKEDAVLDEQEHHFLAVLMVLNVSCGLQYQVVPSTALHRH